uniref:HAUS augmin like complex subunit 4 n=1 Tax=Ornithorhynchus anatinus TaxID=9258 RepID=A0A6I8N2U4_ORNAN
MASGDFCSPVEGLELLQKVCGHQLPPCQIGEEDLLHNPHFAKLLLSLAQRLDGTGLSNALAEEQAQAWKDVRLQKTMWLRSEVLHRVIQEMLVDYYVRARDANLTPEDRKALLRCLALLQKLLQEHRLETQAELDRKHTQYLEVKCKAMILKLRMEELQVLSDTYPAEKVEVHRIIRDSLEEATRTQEQDLENSRRLLGAYEVLGAEFDGLVQEYAQLRQEIDNKRWAIREFDKSCH